MLRSRRGKRVKLCCGETWGVAQARWKPAEESARWKPAVASSGRRRRACGWLSREQRSWRSPELGGRVWWKITIDDPGAGRLTGGYENPNVGLVVWTEMLSLWCNGKWCHRMLLNRRLDWGKTAVFMSKADYLDCVPPVLISLSIWRAPPELSLKTTCLNFIYHHIESE